MAADAWGGRGGMREIRKVGGGLAAATVGAWGRKNDADERGGDAADTEGKT